MPPSTRRTEANRRNALSSTGPTSAVGKDQSRRNALKHGAYATSLAVEGEAFGEDPAQLGEVMDGFIEALDPQDAASRAAAWQVALGYVRARRLAAYETGMLTKMHRHAVMGADRLQQLRLDLEILDWVEEPDWTGTDAPGVAGAILERIVNMDRDLAPLAHSLVTASAWLKEATCEQLRKFVQAAWSGDDQRRGWAAPHRADRLDDLARAEQRALTETHDATVEALLGVLARTVEVDLRLQASQEAALRRFRQIDDAARARQRHEIPGGTDD